VHKCGAAYTCTNWQHYVWVLMQVVMPKPSSSGPVQDPPGVGLVYLQYEDAKSAEKARFALNGRTFEDRVVAATLVHSVLD
jgi:hypothetical protein